MFYIVIHNFVLLYELDARIKLMHFHHKSSKPVNNYYRNLIIIISLKSYIIIASLISPYNSVYHDTMTGFRYPFTIT